MPKERSVVDSPQLFQLAIQQASPCLCIASGKHILDGLKPFALPTLIISYSVLIRHTSYLFSFFQILVEFRSILVYFSRDIS